MKRGIAFFMTCTAMVPAMAQAADGNVFTLGEVAVSTQDRAEDNSTSHSVTAEDIRQFNRDTLDQALLLEPGTSFIKRGQRNETSVYIRGFDARQVPVLIDGIPIYVPYDGYVDMGRFTTWDLSEIQVTKGATSALAGLNAMGGVVNLVSRRPTRPMEAEVRAQASFDGDGAFNGWQTGANGGARIDQFWAQAGITYTEKDHYRMPSAWNGPGLYAENGGFRENSDSTDYKLNFKLGYAPNATDEYAINLISQSGEKGNPPNATDTTTGSGQRRAWRWPAWDKNSLYWLSKTGFANSGYVKTRLYYDTFKNRLDDYTTNSAGTDYSYSTVTNSSWYNDYTVGGSAELGGKLVDWNTLKGAVHYKKDTHRERAAQGIKVGTTNIYSEPWQKTSDETLSLALEDTFHLSPAWDVTPGASYDLRFAGRSDDYNTSTGKMVEVGGQDSKVFNPQIGTVWRFSDSGDAHANIAHRSRFPSLKDLYSQSFGTKLQNANLRPEKVITYEIGASEQVWGNTRLTGNAFYNDIADSIEAVAVSSSVSQNQNVGDARSYGYELGVKSLPLPKWEFGGSYTYTHSWNELMGRRMLGVPLHKVFAYAKYDVFDTVSVQAAATFQSGMLSLGQTSDYTDAYALFDLKADWDVTPWLTAELGVKNLFDALYMPNPGYPEEGRNFFTGVRATF